jgi:hypothetical protein
MVVKGALETCRRVGEVLWVEPRTKRTVVCKRYAAWTPGTSDSVNTEDEGCDAAESAFAPVQSACIAPTWWLCQL